MPSPNQPTFYYDPMNPPPYLQYSPGTQQQFNRWEQSYQQDQQSYQQFDQQNFQQQSPFQDYRDHNQDDSDSSEHNKSVQVESEEEEEQEPVRRPGKKPIGKKAPAKRWSDEEEVALARAWLTISENPDVGNAQKRDGFYKKRTHREEKLRVLQEEKEARVALMRRQQQALDEQQKAVDLKFMMKDHTIYQEPMLQLILDRKREIAARWGWHCPF
ncbi:hypothetical protein R6Q59_023042 [Mikania micrantha]